MVHIDSATVIDCDTKDRSGKESLLGGSFIGADPSDQQS
jgi:hypothetical protein